MFRTQDISGTANVKIAHGDVKSAAQVGKLFNGAKAFAGFVGKRRHGRRQQVTKRFFIGTPHPSTQLMQVAETVMMCVIDDNGVHIRDIQSGFNNGGGDQHIILSFDELSHDLFKLVPLHLTMGNGDFNAGHHPLDHYRDVHDV